jgi:hypothetical protein
MRFIKYALVSNELQAISGSCQTVIVLRVMTATYQGDETFNQGDEIF